MIQKKSIRLNLFKVILKNKFSAGTVFLCLKSYIGNPCTLLFIALLTLNFFNASAQQNESADKIFNRAYHYISVDREKALSLLNKAIALDSAHADAYFHRGVIYFKKEVYEKALADFSQVLALQPERSLMYMYKGFSHRNNGDLNAAMNAFSHYITLHPRDTSAYSYLLRGKMKYELGDFEGAAADYGTALDLEPFEEKYQYYRFLALFEAKQYSKALEAVDRLIEINGDFYGYYFYKGNVYLAMQKYQSAIHMYNIAIIKNYQNADSYFQRATAYEALEKYNEAIEDYNTAILLKPDDGTFYSGRGNCKYDMGLKKAACEDWNEAGALGYYEDFDKMKDVCEALKQNQGQE
ncbi:MAG: tetratricopeptide repeat protein [Fulvivirga sp.]|nr:tetratricopeptide repeat protein [Fulvivirga sp.]